jgi:hypothetical protein
MFLLHKVESGIKPLLKSPSDRNSTPSMTISLYPNLLIYFVQGVSSPGIDCSCNPKFKKLGWGKERLGLDKVGIKSRVSILGKLCLHHGIIPEIHI